MPFTPCLPCACYLLPLCMTLVVNNAHGGNGRDTCLVLCDGKIRLVSAAPSSFKISELHHTRVRTLRTLPLCLSLFLSLSLSLSLSHSSLLGWILHFRFWDRLSLGSFGLHPLAARQPCHRSDTSPTRFSLSAFRCCSLVELDLDRRRGDDDCTDERRWR